MKINKNGFEIAMANACLTVNELANKSKISRVTLRRLTSGRCNPKPATVGKIAKALNISVEEIIEQ